MSYPRDDARPALRDLADAPASLRNLSEACRTGDVNLWPDDQADDERITHADVHRWADALDDILMRAEGYRTRTGRVLTEADLDALAAEAERGYAVEDILARTEGFEPWKVWLMAGAVFLVGVLAGAVLMMALS